jgi:hypothetical protein
VPNRDLAHLFQAGPTRWSNLALEGREWRHEERLRAAFLRTASRSTVTLSAARRELVGTADRSESDAPWRLWITRPDRARAEFALGTETIIVAVHGRRWWSWSPLQGERTGDPDFQTGLGPGMILADPQRLLSAFAAVRIVGERQIAGREGVGVVAEAVRSAEVEEPHGSAVWAAMSAVSLAGVESELGMGADAYELVIDRELGIVLYTEAMLAGKAFRRCEVTGLTVDEPLEPELFFAHKPLG